MNDQDRAAIRRAYLHGEPVWNIAKLAKVTELEAETYLRWWCDRGCPGEVTDDQET